MGQLHVVSFLHSDGSPGAPRRRYGTVLVLHRSRAIRVLLRIVRLKVDTETARTRTGTSVSYGLSSRIMVAYSYS
eukprot:scaffold269566_cov25-Prasinocladus_malaysianus.AAC.1